MMMMMMLMFLLLLIQLIACVPLASSAVVSDAVPPPPADEHHGAALPTTDGSQAGKPQQPASNHSQPYFELEDSELNTHTGVKGDFWWELECEELMEDTDEVRPIYHEAAWVLMRGAYYAIVGNKGYDEERTPTLFGNGFHTPIYVGYHPEMGRGVFAAAPIPNNTVIWDDKFAACFEHGWQVRNFLLSIPKGLACDVLIWAYGVKLDDGTVKVCCDLDEGSFVNKADYREDVNAVEVMARDGDGNGTLYSTRDIAAGEQILVNYMDFSFEEAWEMIGL